MTNEALRKRDDILVECLYTLADSEFSKTVVFQGGGAMHFIYSSPRYSADIDFVDPTITQDIEEYKRKLFALGSGKYEINSIKSMPSNKGVRAKWGHKANEPVGKLEIEERSTDEYRMSDSKFRLLVKTPADIYTDKIFANIARYVSRVDITPVPFKPSDLFDLEYLTKTLGQEPVSKESILKRARRYDAEHIVNRENISKLTAIIRDENKQDNFRECIRKSMMPDVFRLMVFDKAYFDKAAEHFERYM